MRKRKRNGQPAADSSPPTTVFGRQQRYGRHLFKIDQKAVYKMRRLSKITKTKRRVTHRRRMDHLRLGTRRLCYEDACLVAHRKSVENAFEEGYRGTKGIFHDKKVRVSSVIVAT